MKMSKHLLFLSTSTLMGLSWALIVMAHPQSLATEQPRVISAAAPIFPALANAARVSGDVVVEVKIDASGMVTSAHAEGHALLRKVSETAAKRWRFASAESSIGIRTARLTFTFRALEKEMPEDRIAPVFYPPYRVEVMHNPNILQTTKSH
jgi:TonB family protein